MEEGFNKKHSGNNLARILLGIIMVFIGVVYFLKTTGLIDIQINIDIWQLWPLIIIFLGLSLISVRGWFSFLLGIIISLIILAIIFFAIFPGYNGIIKKIKKPPLFEKIPVGLEQETGPTGINMPFDRKNNTSKAQI